MTADLSGRAVREAYDALADAYDLLTAEFAHDRWLLALETLALEHGLQGRRLLDVACGTGKSFLPLLQRGYDVTGCDLSPAMLAHASAAAPTVRLFEADMRALPQIGEFDLVTCLDDAINYVSGSDDLLATLRSLRQCLAPSGLVVWDVNTLAMYRSAFAQTWAVEDDAQLVLWRGGVRDTFRAGGLAHADVDVFEREPDGWRRTSSHHEQRHWPASSLIEKAREAGLEVLAACGQHRGAVVEASIDERSHTKAVFVACRDDRETRRG